MTAVRVAIATCLLTCSTPSFADKSAIATDLFNQGIALMDQGKFQRACPFMEASYRQEPLLGALLALADCEYERGRLNAALSRYQEYVNRHDNLADTARYKQGNRLFEAKARITELKRSVPSVKVTVSPKVKVPILRLDGMRIRPGETYPIDPGTHELTLEVHDHETKVVQIQARKGQAQEVPLTAGKWIRPKYIPKTSSIPVTDDAEDEHNDRVIRNAGVAIGCVVLGAVIVSTLVGARPIDVQGTGPGSQGQFRSANPASFSQWKTSQSPWPASYHFMNSTFGGVNSVPTIPASTFANQPSVLPMVQFGQSPEQPVIFGIQGLF